MKTLGIVIGHRGGGDKKDVVRFLINTDGSDGVINYNIKDGLGIDKGIVHEDGSFEKSRRPKANEVMMSVDYWCDLTNISSWHIAKVVGVWRGVTREGEPDGEKEIYMLELAGDGGTQKSYQSVVCYGDDEEVLYDHGMFGTITGCLYITIKNSLDETADGPGSIKWDGGRNISDFSFKYNHGYDYKSIWFKKIR